MDMHLSSSLPRPSIITALPSELVQHIFSFLSHLDLCRISRTCRYLHENAISDQLWANILRSYLPHPIPSPAPCSSYRQLFAAHFPYWFLTKYKIWFSDHTAGGRLIIIRYDHRRGCIEGYALAAERQDAPSGLLNWDDTVLYHGFIPKIQLDLNQPLLRLDLPKRPRPLFEPLTRKLQREKRMDIHADTNTRLFSTMILSKPLASEAIAPSVSIWPPLILPSPGNVRVRNASPSDFNGPGQKPGDLSELSESSFRIRQWVDFAYFNNGIGPSRLAENVSTYATLSEESYTPTASKPFQGIWVGDYSGHGCEFLLIRQPDDPLPLPDLARRAFDNWPMTPSTPWTTLGNVAADRPNLDGEDSSEASFHTVGERAPDVSPYKGRLEAIKLTGDPHVPRGEYTFIAEDIGQAGHVGYANEAIFNEDPRLHDASSADARIVKCAGHVAGRGFMDDTYIPTHLILMGKNKLAHYWRPFGHVSFYERVNINDFLDVSNS